VKPQLSSTAVRLGRRAYACLAVAGLAVFALVLATGIGGSTASTIVDPWLLDGLLVVAVLVLATRVVLVRDERGAWAALALGLACWAAGDLSFDLVYGGNPPVPSGADLLYLAFYPCCYVALVLLFRSRISHISRNLWLDGLTAALTACALGSAVLVQAVVETTQGSLETVATNLAYPLGDTLLLALVVSVFVLAGKRRPGRTWLLLGAGLLTTTIADGIYLFQAATNTYAEGSMLDLLWPAAMLLLVWAGLEERKRTQRVELEGRPLLGTSLVCGLVAIGIFAADHFHRLNPLAGFAAGLALACVVARAFLTFRENRRILERMREQTVTDALTGLRNRRGLLADLDVASAAAGHGEPWVFAIFDLNGFKQYNDTFGHPAGDGFLSRLGRRLRESVESEGTAYRLGGDEFCILCTAGDDSEALVARAVEALSERSEAFKIEAAYGVAYLPLDASDASEALRIADARLYAQKRGATAGRGQPHEVVLQALFERDPDLRAHVGEVAALAVGVGHHLGFDAVALEELRLAAELHDIGKLGVPDEILRKPGPLTEDEWGFIKRHTLVGQRILAVAPMLSRVGAIVRATHERWDGDGYPDGLAGDEIPLAARIIAVCDAYTAMTTERAYRLPVSSADAVEELTACAGTQFDSALVPLLVVVLLERAREHTAAEQEPKAA
jgi:diguanylate cyclase (GGDEF)-like protein